MRDSSSTGELGLDDQELGWVAAGHIALAVNLSDL
jgi:hypothetical protein